MATSISNEKEASGQTFESENDDVAFKNDIESFAKRVDEATDGHFSTRMAEELSMEGERLFKHLGDFYHEAGLGDDIRRYARRDAHLRTQEAQEIMLTKNVPVDSHTTTKDVQDECVNEPNTIQDVHRFAMDLVDSGAEEIDAMSTGTLGMGLCSGVSLKGLKKLGLDFPLPKMEVLRVKPDSGQFEATREREDRFMDRVGSPSNGDADGAGGGRVGPVALPSLARRASNVEAGANSRPNTDHETRTRSSWNIEDCGVEGAMDDMLDSAHSVEQVVSKKSSAFDVELRATREALGYERGAQLLIGDEYREADLTTKGKAQATTPGRNKKKSKGGIKSRGSRETSTCSSYVVSVLAAVLMGVFTLFGTDEMSSTFFVVAEGATSGGLQSFGHFDIADDLSPLSSLSRNLRGGADPATILPEIHSVVQSQRRLLQEIYDMYKEGDRVAFELALKSSAGEASDKETSLETDLPQLFDFFDPAFLMEVLASVEAIDDALEDVIESTAILRPQQLPKPDIAQTVTGRHLQNTNGAGMPKDSPDMTYHLPPVCTDKCAPTDTSCLCERLANCTKTMTHYDLAVLFADGYIQNDTSSGLTASDINLFNVGDDAWITFESILHTSHVIDTRNSSQCYAFLDQFHQSCDPLSGTTCSNTNTETFQLSVDEVCEGVDTAVKLLTVPIGQVFDGYASKDVSHCPSTGFVTNTTTCGAERVSFQVCQRFVKEFEKLYGFRNKTQYPSPNRMGGVTELAFTEIHNETQYCEDVRVQQCKDQCHLMYLSDVSDESAANCTAACSTLMCADTVDDQYGTCIENECKDKYMVLPASEYKSCPAGLEIPYDECLSAAQSYTQEWISQGRGDTSSNTLGKEGIWFNTEWYGFALDKSWTESNLLDKSFHQAHNPANNSLYSTTPGYDPNAQIVCKNPACVGCEYWLLSAVDCDDSEDFIYDGSSKQIKFKDSYGQVRCLTNDVGDLYMSSCNELTNSQWYYDKNAKALKTFGANNYCMSVDPANNLVFMSQCGAIPGQGVLFIESCQTTSGYIDQECVRNYTECPSELGLSSITSKGHCQFALSSLLDSPTLVDMNDQSWEAALTPCGCFVWDSDGIHYDFLPCPATDMDPVASEYANLACIKENNSSQSILIPNSWIPEISITGLYQQVRVNYDVTLCMTVEDQNDEGTNCILNIAEAGGKCVWMKDCVGTTDTVPGQTSNNQAFYFDPSTYAIRTFENYCLEYDTGTGVNNTNQQASNLYASPSCTGATNQQFFYDLPSGAIKTFYDKCIDMDYTTGDKFYNLYLNGCNERYNQQFIIPQVWIPDIFLDSIRLVNTQQTLCWTAQTELHSNNVNMTSCTSNIPNQNFEYNPQARSITIYGLCLGYVTATVDYGVASKTATVNNVNLQPCDGSEAQRWAYESNGQISNMKAGCIEFASDTVNGNGNLYLSEMSCGSCGMRRNQTLYIGSNCPNTKTYDKVFVEEEDCNAQCQSKNCNPSAGGLIFDSWNDGSSCGMQEGQEVWVGCDDYANVYVVLDDCEKKCGSCSSTTNLYFESYVSSCGMKRQQHMYTCGSNTTNLYVVEDDCNDHCNDDCTDTDSEVEGGLIFDSLNVNHTSCGLTQGQEVWVGCGYVYAVEGDCTTQCGTNGCSTTSKLYFTSWLPASYKYQIFRIPSKWSAVDHEPLYDSARPIPTGLWNGDWNKVTDCQIDLLEGVLQTCDDSMSLLLGDMTSLGTLQEINWALNDTELGPEKAMPGSCCLDDPSTSEWFGYYYATSVTYEGKPMECQNTGPWHLGISEEACSNAGGRWFPSPCYTLQTCINDRPANGTQGYSPSFEQFASRITITDPSNSTQCNNARQQLGYAPDYPFDVDVCRTFYEQECSTLWLSVDGLAGNWSSKGEQTTPAPAGISRNYETTFKVGYCEIDGSGTCTAPQGSRGRGLQDENGANRRLQGTTEQPPGWSTSLDLDSHEGLDQLALDLTYVQATQAGLQLIYDSMGFFKD
ncbi:hypothetical protein THAOC_35064, partial [Thalassiosira oceanica]